jgi:hypothetical protein
MACPPNVAVDVLTNPVPFSVIWNDPSPNVEGVIEAIVGTGFVSVTVALSDFAELALLVAVTVTLPRPTILFGAV